MLKTMHKMDALIKSGSKTSREFSVKNIRKLAEIEILDMRYKIKKELIENKRFDISHISTNKMSKSSTSRRDKSKRWINSSIAGFNESAI